MGILVKNVGKRRYAYLVDRMGGKVQHRYLGRADQDDVVRLIEEDRFASSVPRGLWGLFWDTDPGSIQLGANRRYVIERVLTLGGLDAVRWLQRVYTAHQILQVARTSRSLDERSRGFWILWFGGNLVPEHSGKEDDLGDKTGKGRRHFSKRGARRRKRTGLAPGSS